MKFRIYGRQQQTTIKSTRNETREVPVIVVINANDEQHARLIAKNDKINVTKIIEI